jgi:2-polyprenyl-6-methoxyphenol hydroxylase-like FAD-dependent oxidoreductase
MITPQTNVDQAIGAYAVAQGADVRRGIEVIGLQQDADGVYVTARQNSGSENVETRWRARYVIGADGAHSTVRALLGVDFPGKTLLSSIVLADVKLTHGPTGGGLTLGSTRNEFAFLAPYDRHEGDGRWYRAMVWDRKHQAPDSQWVDSEEIESILTRAMKADLGLSEIGWKSRFHCDERQVEQYRHGRVFLAGDAAHVHSPMGGQGMNTGIQDAANLAWKIDAALAGADDAVLDSYQDERHPIGKRVLLQSGMMARGVTLHPRIARSMRNMLAPRILRIPRIRDALAGSFAGTTLRYPHRADESALVGTRATQIPLISERLTQLQREPGFVLIRECGRPAVGVTDLHQAERADAGPAVLVRPDGYIAWAGDSANCAQWLDALARWTAPAARPRVVPATAS